MTRKPNLFIIGAAKSGTTSLFNYLKEHPDIFAASIKEPRYLNWPEFKKLDCGVIFRKLVIKTEEEYLSLFNGVDDEKYLMDGSVFTMFFRDSLIRIKKLNSENKVIIAIRNPVDRFMSHYSMQIYRREISKNIKGFLKYPIGGEGVNLLELGLYSTQIQNALDILGRENVHVVLFEDLKNDSGTCLQELFEFLDIENISIPEANVIYNKSRGIVKNNSARNIFRFLEKLWYRIGNPENKFFRTLKNFIRSIVFRKNKPSEDVRDYLYNYYKGDIVETEKITGLDLSKWKNCL